MFFEEEDDALFNPEIFHVVRRELYALGSTMETTPYALRSVPTHTEDGIPIRKLYVANLPAKTTRTELFGVFAQYGFIRSCWLRMGDKGPHRVPMPTYAFVTFSDPADAHKALLAPNHEKILRGRTLRISPADSWHQPVEDGEVKIRWKPRTCQEAGRDSASQDCNNAEDANNENSNRMDDLEEEDILPLLDGSTEYTPYNILEVLNQDCLHHIFSYIPIRDLVRSERVSKAWQSSIQEYLESVRVFKTSWWQHVGVTLTTAVLRRVLQRLGGALLRLHIDHHWSALNDRTAHTVGKFCPNLEELKIVGMQTKNWNPLIYGCRNLKSVAFVSCNKLTDSSLIHAVKQDSCIESMTIANNTHVTGLFLTGANPTKLTSLSFYNCYSLQGTVLSAALDTLPSLKCLKLDVCPVTMWKIIPLILKKLPDLEELSLSEYMSIEITLNPQGNTAFCEAVANLTKLKILNISRNIYITNAVLKQLAQSCPQLESINISGCNARKGYPHPLTVVMNESTPVYPGVSDEGVAALCAGCPALRHLDVSYLAALSDAGLAAAARLPRLAALVARGNAALSAQPLAAAIYACHRLQEVDACGCDGVSEELVEAAVHALHLQPRVLTLRLAATAAAQLDLGLTERTYPTHPLLRLDVDEDRSNPHLRPDFVDQVFDDSSDDSMNDMYDPEDFDDFIGHDDDLFLDEDGIEDYEGVYAYGIDAPIIIL
ncbi:putative RNA-binding protein EEED8.10 [Epargyreus clarus]|uniref:putative RNA-binding protein EEED8.10 n=1 Tax=Epargyreus clarus TaxID=520877 RepID=UPI003C2F3E11